MQNKDNVMVNVLQDVIYKRSNAEGNDKVWVSM